MPRDVHDRLAESEAQLAKLRGPADDGFRVSLRALLMCRIALMRAGLFEVKEC